MVETSTLSNEVPRAGWSAGVAVSLEAVCYAALAIVATVLRLVDLGWFPLDPQEAAHSLSAWQAAGGQTFDTTGVSPLLFQLQVGLFWLLQGGDAQARLVSAVAGVLLVLAAAGLRPLVGRVAALATALLLALGPAWTFFGREVSPAALSSLWVLLLLGLLAQGGRRSALWTPVVLGLLVATGGVLFSFGVAVVLGWLALRLRGKDGPQLDALLAPWAETDDRRRAVLLFVVTVVLAATGLLLRPEGFAALLQLPAGFVGQAATGSGPFLGLAVPLVSYLPVTAVFGLAGLVVAARSGQAFGRFLSLWVLVGALAALFAGPATLVDLMLPLTIAAGAGLGALATSLSQTFRWREEGLMTAILLVVAGYLLLTGFRAVSMAQTTQEEIAQTQLPLGLLVVALLVVVYWFLWGGATTLRVLGLTWLVVGTLLAWSGGTALNYRAPLALAEPLRPQFVSTDGARLARDLAEAARVRGQDPAALATVVDPALERVLAWELRQLERQGKLRWATAAGEITEDAVVVPGVAGREGDAPAFGPAAYMGRAYRIAGSFTPPFLTPEGFDPWLALRWLLLREPARDATLGDSVQLEPASLYLKVDEGVTQ